MKRTFVLSHGVGALSGTYILLTSALLSGCLDLSTDHKFFKGSLQPDAGPAVCQCTTPQATCRGNSRSEPISASCAADGGCEVEWHDTLCPDGCADAHCLGNACLGVLCSHPPASTCKNSSTLLTYSASGTCNAGSCSYNSAETDCGSGGCSNGVCLADPCLGVTCTSVPSAICISSTTARAFASPGTCNPSTASCDYVPVDTACGSAGCTAGHCNVDKCAGVVCNTAPAATCTDTKTSKTFSASGTCDPASGQCVYPSTDNTCPGTQECNGGICADVNPACNSTNCQGCCQGSTCKPYASESLLSCGANGATCQACANTTGSCVVGVCRTDLPTWVKKTLPNSPVARDGMAMAYDSVRHLTVLFGGRDGYAYFNDTWEYDGTNWTMALPHVSPTSRYRPYMTYDSDRHVIVLFGGKNGTDLHDTWEYDGTNWVQKATTLYPPMYPPTTTATENSIAYDANRHVTVMVVSYRDYSFTPPVVVKATWEYNGTDWTKVGHVPSTAVTAENIAYDSTRKVILMIGNSYAPSKITQETWSYDGTAWTQAAPLASPKYPGSFSGMVYDDTRHVSVVFGADYSSINLTNDETWEYNGTTWYKNVLATVPSERSYPAIVYDSARKVAVMFGGHDSGHPLNETWEYGN